MTAIESTRRREPLSTPNDPDFTPNGYLRRIDDAPPTSGAQAQHDRGLADAVRNARQPATKPHGDGVLYLGMNRRADEVAVLQAATGGQVTTVMGTAGAKVDTKFGSFDLTKAEELSAFRDGLIDHYGLSKEQGDAVFAMLDRVKERGGSGRDELARLALYFARAESGNGDLPSRLVLSGHSSSGMMWGDPAGSQQVGGFDLALVRRLGEIFPKAAAQVEDVHFSGCFTYRQVDGDEWQKTFPNLKTLWGYSDYTPGDQINHFAPWVRMTQGRNSDITARQIAPYKAVLAWSRTSDVVDHVQLDLSATRAAAESADTRFDAYLSGARAVHHGSDNAARNDYRAYHQLAMRKDISPAERAEAEHRAAVMFRVRFYEQGVRHAFEKEHGAEIADAFHAVGVPLPKSFAEMSREEALERIDAFRHAAGAPARADVAAASHHLERLAALDPTFITSDWCE
ncbi:MAG: hypothetical protein KIT84_21680 [Labilithrix sp.]|nr:hypothetical protein [Labilithrix sp.]MCW5813655.1 hypothetical protein [Labilithrix sp.]